MWALRQDGAYVDVVYDWRVRADKPLLRYGPFIFQPLFAVRGPTSRLFLTLYHVFAGYRPSPEILQQKTRALLTSKPTVTG